MAWIPASAGMTEGGRNGYGVCHSYGDLFVDADEVESGVDFNARARDYGTRPRMDLPKPGSAAWGGLMLFGFCLLYIVLGAVLAGLILASVEATGYVWRLDTLAGRLLLVLAIVFHQAVILRVLAPILRPSFRREEIVAMHQAFLAPAGEAFVFVPNVFRGQIHTQVDVRIEEQAIVITRRGGLEGALATVPILLALTGDISERDVRVLVPAGLVALLVMGWLWRESRRPVVRRYRANDVRRIEIDHNLYRFKVRGARLRLPTTYVFALAPELQPEFDASLEEAFPGRVQRLA